MSRVLIITGILPIQEIKDRKKENDIILVTEDEINKESNNFTFSYIYIIPFSNRILASLSSKWKSFFDLRKKKMYLLRERLLFIFPVLLFPKKIIIDRLLLKISVFLQRKRLEVLINDFKPTLIHAQDSGPSASIARMIHEKYKIPFIITPRGLNGNLSKKEIIKNLSRANEILSISHVQKKQVNEIAGKKSILIPHGISDSFYDNNKYRLEGKLKFIFVGRLIKLKNIDKVIEALALCENDYVFDIYGEGPEQEYLKKLILQRGLSSKIFLKGWIAHENLSQVLSTYNLFIMPSKPESLGRVYFEAMASKLPVIATKDTGIDGIITNKQEGFLVEPTVDSIHNILLEIFANKRVLIKMSDKAYNNALKYTWDNTVKSYTGIYRKFN